MVCLGIETVSFDVPLTIRTGPVLGIYIVCVCGTNSSTSLMPWKQKLYIGGQGLACGRHNVNLLTSMLMCQTYPKVVGLLVTS